MILWQKRLAPAYSSFVAHRFYDLSSLSGVVPSGHQPSLTQPISVLKSSISPTVVTDFQKLMWHLQVALSVFAIFVSVYIILFCIASDIGVDWDELCRDNWGWGQVWCPCAAVCCRHLCTSICRLTFWH